MTLLTTVVLCAPSLWVVLGTDNACSRRHTLARVDAASRTDQYNLHLGYGDIHADSFQDAKTSATGKTWRFSGSAASAAIQVGPSAVLARDCHLTSVEIQKTSAFGLSAVDAFNTLAIVGELVMMHVCESGTEDDFQRAVDLDKGTLMNATKKLHTLMTHAHDYMGSKEDIQEFKDKKNELATHIDELKQRLSQDSLQRQRERDFHRPPVPKLLAIHTFLAGGSDKEDQLVEFVLGKLQNINDESKQVIPLSDALILSRRQDALQYEGHVWDPPCTQSVMRFLILKPQKISFEKTLELHHLLTRDKNDTDQEVQEVEIPDDYIVDKLQLVLVNSDFSSTNKRFRTDDEEFWRKIKFGTAFGVCSFVVCVCHMCHREMFESETRMMMIVSWTAGSPLLMMILSWCGVASVPVIGDGVIGAWNNMVHWTLAGGLWGIFLLPAALVVLFTVIIFGVVMFLYTWPVYFFGFGFLGLVLNAWIAIVHHATWLHWTISNPLANLLMAFMGDYAMSALTMAFPAFVLPYHAYREKKANCFSGTDWEVHLSFGVSIAIHSFLWSIIMQPQLVFKEWWQRIFVLVIYVLATMDMYMDGNFIVVAESCGSQFHVTLAIWTYAIGVIFAQYVVGSIFFMINSRWHPFLALNYMALLYPPELPAAAEESYKSLGNGFAHAFADEKTQHTMDRFMTTVFMLVICLARSFGEDLVQAGIQWHFTDTVKKNPMVMFSIICSVAAFVFHMGKAGHFLYKNKA